MSNEKEAASGSDSFSLLIFYDPSAALLRAVTGGDKKTPAPALKPSDE